MLEESQRMIQDTSGRLGTAVQDLREVTVSGRLCTIACLDLHNLLGSGRESGRAAFGPRAGGRAGNFGDSQHLTTPYDLVRPHLNIPHAFMTELRLCLQSCVRCDLCFFTFLGLLEPG